MIDFEKLKDAIIKNPSIVAKYLPDGVVEGVEYRCANIYGGKGESFAINLNNGLWSDFATGETGASLIDLVSKQKDIPFKEAAEIIAKELGGDFPTDVIKPERRKHLTKKQDILIPKKPPFKHPTHIFIKGLGDTRIDGIWEYKNEQGYIIAYDARVDKLGPDGKMKKDVFPLRWDGKKWYTRALPEPRPLFNLDKIAEDKNGEKQIVIVEGCKTAKAAEYYFPNYIVTTWQGGCKAVKLADWSSIYGRKVIIIPDADKQIDPATGDFFTWDNQPGMKAANQIADILYKNRSLVRIVNTKSLGDIKSGWDVADALEGGMKQSELVDFIRKNIYEYRPIEIRDDDIVEPDVVIQQKRSNLEYDDTYFFCLGVEGKNQYFYQRRTGQILGYVPSSYKKESLISLAPLSWWEANFPSKSGVAWEEAVDWLCRTQEKCRMFDKRMIRGRGAWFDDGKPVLNLGTSIFVDGNVLDIDEFKSNYIYEKRPALALKLQTVLPKEDSYRLVEICRLARWEKPYYGDLLAGWMFAALVCGAMPFRSHLYLIGAAGTGKSWILDNIIKPIMGKIALSVSSKTTEPGIREALRGDILPVIFDEAEAENKIDKARIQAIFDLARQASSEANDAIYKGGSNGSGGFSYLCRSSFLFASINNSMTKDADMSRTAVIKLKNAPTKANSEERKKDNEQFRELERQVSKTFTPEYCRCLLTRALHSIPRMRKCASVIADICAREYGSRRIGDQMGMILAGLWCLKYDNDITEQAAKGLIEYCAIQKEKEDAGDDITQEERCLNHLVYSEVAYDRQKYPLSMLIAHLLHKDTIQGVNRVDLEQSLANRGVKVDMEYLYLSRNEKSIPASVFKDTEWDGRGWKDALLRLEGVKVDKAKRFCPSLVSSVLVIPLNYLFL